MGLKTFTTCLVLSVSMIPSSRGFAPASHTSRAEISQAGLKLRTNKSRLIHSTNLSYSLDRGSRQFQLRFKDRARRILNPIAQSKKQQRDFLSECHMVLELSNKDDFLHNNIDVATTSDGPSILQESSLENLTRKGQNNIIKTEDAFTSTPSESPGILSISKFALPAIGVWLCGPLLSLIDTAVVGLFAGTNHQAALSPAVALTDYAALLLAFLFAATTNLVSASSTSAQSSTTQQSSMASPDKNESAQATLISSLQLSTFVGAGLGFVMFVLTNVLLKALIGNDAIDPTVFNPASQYVKIRALGMPAAAILGSAQAACLGLKDIRSPLMILGAAAGVNLLGDLVFVRSKYALFSGAAGAAWATILSQYTAVFLFLKWLKTRPRKSNEEVDSMDEKKWKVGPMGKIEMQSRAMTQTGEMETTNNQPTEKTHKKQLTTKPRRIAKKPSFSTRGFLHESPFKKRNIISFPSRNDAAKFIPYVVPVTTTSVGRVSLFLAMAHVSSSLGTIGMAAQQIVLALFEAFCPVVDSLSLTAQSFIPAAMAERESLQSQDNDNLRMLTMDFIKTGVLFGSSLVLAVCCIPMITKFFTTDLLVMNQVHAILPYLGGIFAMHGVVMATEGVLLGRRDLNFLGWMYGIYFAAMPALMLRVKHAVLHQGKTGGLTSVWKIFLGYQASRTVLWLGRALWLSRKEKSIEETLVPQPI